MNSQNIEISTGELRAAIPQLHAGDRVFLSGNVYTARDAVHKELFRMLDARQELPFPLAGSVIYYAGPTPGHGGLAVGSCGPTTSSRMDRFAPRLLDLGLLGMIGKGERSVEVSEAITRNGAVYFCAVGGAGALIARQIVSAEEIAFPHLGCESVKRLEIRRLPLTVAIDSRGGDIFKLGRERYATT